jgi:hypothetical protein
VDRKGKRAIAVSEYAEGSYAVPDDPPSSKKKRKQQHESFMATEPVHGDGPYGYYGGMSISSSRCWNLTNSFFNKTSISNTPFDIQNAIQERERASLQYQYTGQLYLPSAWRKLTCRRSEEGKGWLRLSRDWRGACWLVNLLIGYGHIGVGTFLSRGERDGKSSTRSLRYMKLVSDPLNPEAELTTRISYIK